MKKKTLSLSRYLLTALSAATLLAATSCELFLSDSGSGGGGGTEIIVDSPYKIDFGSSSTKTLTLTSLSGKSVYLVKSNVSSSIASDINTGYAASTYASSRSVTDVPIERSINSTDLISGNFNGNIRFDYQPARDFNANPPAIETARARNLVSIEGTALFEYDAVGEIKSFNVQNKAGAWISISTTLRAIGEHCYIWVPDSNFGSGGATDDKIDLDQVNALRDKFDVIYPLETNVLGYEYGGGSDGGVDNDLHISILVYDIGDNSEESADGGIYGYFWSKDFYTQEQLTTYGSSYQTNLAEMFYIDSYFTDADPETIYSTLVHEFQHMINFNRKNVEQGISSETWYNEMLSQLAEDMINSHISGDTSASPAELRIPLLNGYYDLVGVNQWIDYSSSQSMNLISYSTTYGFGAFLARNYGGAILIKAMEDNAASGTSSISLALHSVDPYTFTDTISGFKNVFRRYGEAFVYSGTSIPDGAKTFDKTVLTEINDITYVFPAIDIWELDNRLFILNPADMISGALGPTVWDIGSVADMSPYSVSILSAMDWQEIESDLTVTLYKPADPDVEFYLMIR